MELSAQKMYTYLRGFATGGSKTQLLNALSYARRKHEGQMRKSGEEYISHPLIMACHAISLGIHDDNILAAILLHDVIEDCGVDVSELPVCDEVKKAVKALSFVKSPECDKPTALKMYYDEISENYIAAIAKIIDRCHNISTMVGVFSTQKVKEYISETKEYVLPLIRRCKDTYPEFANSLFAMKYHITSVLDAAQWILNIYCQ